MIDTMARSARSLGDRYSSNVVKRASHSDRNHYATSSRALMQDISGYPLDF
jgi:DNA/RNA endonuclease YhcR with UshA esterase domain